MSKEYDTCIVGYLVPGAVEPHWEVFDAADTTAAKEMWKAKHGAVENDDNLHASPYNKEDVARAYGLIPQTNN